jgi:hypothetical protein
MRVPSTSTSKIPSRPVAGSTTRAPLNNHFGIDTPGRRNDGT